MTRCAAFYEKWARDPNWCEKTKSSVSEINSYLSLLDEFEERGVPKKFAIANLAECAARPIFREKDPVVKDKIVTAMVEYFCSKNGEGKGEIKRKQGKNIKELIRKVKAERVILPSAAETPIDGIKFYPSSSENMKQVEDNSVHMVVSSPPYNNKVGYDCYDDNKPHDDYITLLAMVLRECQRKLVSGGRIALILPAITGKKFSITFIPQLLEHNGFFFRDLIVWQKHTANSFGNEHGTAWGSWCSPSNPSLRSVYENIFIAHKHSSSLKSENKADITPQEFLNWTTDLWLVNPSTHRLHPAVFPVELIERLLKLYTFPSMTVLDPFCGIGTVAKACRKLGRKFVGYDISRNYIAIAERELRES